MMKTKLFTKITLACLLFLVVMVISPTHAFAAGKLSLEPSSKYVNKGDEFEIRVTIDSESNKIFGVDAVVNYRDSDLEVKSIINGGFFTDFNSASGGNKIEIHGLFSNLYETKSGIGTVAVIKLAAKSESGISELTFACGSTNESQILNENGNNILTCNSLNNSNIFFGQTQTTTTPSPKPTIKPTVKPSAKPTIKPSTSPVAIALSSYPPSPSPSPLASPMVEPGVGAGWVTSLPLPVIIGIAVLGLLLLAIIITLVRSAQRSREMNRIELPTSPTMPSTPQENQPNPPTTL